MLVLKLSSGWIIAEITLEVKATAEEEEGAEVLVYVQNGSVLGGSCLFLEAYIIWVRGVQKDCQRRQRATAVVRHKATSTYRGSWPGTVIGVKHAHAATPSQCINKPGGRSEIQASKGSDMLRSPSIQIEANH